MTSYTVDLKKGRVRAGELDYLFKPKKIRGASKYGVILVHGAGTPLEYLGGGGAGVAWASSEIPARLAAAGIPSVGAVMSGDSFANNASMTDMTAALALLGTAGCSTAKAHIIGVSMGGVLINRWAGLNPTKVASMTGIIPTTDVNKVYTNNQGGFRATIGTAWGVTYPASLPASASLLTAAAPAIDAADIPYKAFYSPTDSVIIPQDVIDWAAAVGGTATNVDVGSATGHTEYTVKKFIDRPDLSGTPDELKTYINWIKGLGA